MGLGSTNKNTRKEFRKVAGKQDWKATINSVKDAHEFIRIVRESMPRYSNGEYFSTVYLDNKIKLLEKYIHEAPSATMTLKEFENVNNT